MLSNCLIISDGSKGMENQSIALAKLLELDFKILKIKPNLLIRLFPTFYHYFYFFFNMKLSFLNKKDYQVVITTGKRMSGYSILIKKIKQNKIINIHIQNPKIDPSSFDLLVLPEHDNKVGNNIIHTVGSLSFFDKSDINESFKLIKKKPFKFNKPTVFLLLGGKNKRYRTTNSDYCKFLLEVKKSVETINGNLIISTSQRTPTIISKIVKIIFKNFESNYFLINEKDKYYYPGILKKTDFAIVTSDSVNMVSEISNTNIPLFVGYLKKEKGKINEFHNSLERNNYSRTFEGKLFSYKKNLIKLNLNLKKNALKHLKNLSE